MYINVDSSFNYWHSGFTPGGSTCNCIATLCNIAQLKQDFDHPTSAAFVDLRAAFDSLSRVVATPDKAWYHG